MNPERWQQIERLYHAALECEAKDRDKFIADACEGETCDGKGRAQNCHRYQPSEDE